MPRYKVSFADEAGARQSAFVDGPSVAWVQASLERRGRREVQVHGEDVLSAEGRDLEAEGRWTPEPPASTLSPVLRFWGVLLGALFLFDAARFWRHGPRLDWSMLVTLGVLVFAVLSVSPLLVNQALSHAAAWHRWRRVLQLLPLIEKNPLLSAPGVRFHFGQRRATALVGLGRVDEGLAFFDQVAPLSGMGAPALDVERSSLLLLAQRNDQAIALRRAAAALDARFAFDAAIAILRYGDDVPEARRLLASREGEPGAQLGDIAIRPFEVEVEGLTVALRNTGEKWYRPDWELIPYQMWFGLGITACPTRERTSGSRDGGGRRTHFFGATRKLLSRRARRWSRRGGGRR